MGIVEEARKIIYDTFGEFSAKKVDAFAEEINSKRRPKEFLDRCKSFVAAMLGEEIAMSKFSRLYEKYT